MIKEKTFNFAPIKSQCLHCKNYYGDLTCPAFPSGIPDTILFFGEQHTTPKDGQKGVVVFEAK